MVLFAAAAFLMASCGDCNRTSGECTASTEACSERDTNEVNVDLSALKETKFTNDELLKWTFTGKGRFVDESGRQTCLEESSDSFGVGIFSPQSYSGDVVLRYKVMALNAATVLVNLVAMSDAGESEAMTLPAAYDGSMAPILAMENYFIAFRNSPHATAPFIKKNPVGDMLTIADEDDMLPGVYYDIEVGRVGKQIWLKVDGDTVVSYTDETPLSGGYLGIRLRGTAGHAAVALIKDVSILSAK